VLLSKEELVKHGMTKTGRCYGMEKNVRGKKKEQNIWNLKKTIPSRDNDRLERTVECGIF
jgi:hypothetical protein